MESSELELLDGPRSRFAARILKDSRNPPGLAHRPKLKWRKHAKR